MQKIKNGFIKNIVSALLAATLMFPITLFAGCGLKSSDYTEKEHIKRVSERVEKRYFADDGKYEYTDYEIYPVYDANEDLAYFVVDFQPYGFVYIGINRADLSNFWGASMYVRYSKEGESWQRYTLNEEEKIWETDEDGQYIYYQNSHFKVAGIENEKRYLLEVDGESGMIPAVKRKNGYLNLVSMEIIDEQEFNSGGKTYSTAYIAFFPDPTFDL